MKSILLTLCLTTTLIVFGQDFRNDYSLNEKYAIVVGISKYKSSSNNLNFAQKDAEDFKNALIDYGLFKKENIKLLINNDASRENIRKNVEGWLRNNAKKNDEIIIYFIGHGAQIPDTDGDESDALDECLVPYDFDTKDYSTLISDDIFAYWIRNLQSENILIIFDNCFSGGAAKEKGVQIAGIKGNLGKDDFMKDISRELPKKGTALLAASKADQVSFESNEFENGIFTHFLLNSICAASDNDLNKIISARELFYATREKTLEYSKDKYKREQEPIFLDLLVNDLDLFHLPFEKRIHPNVDNKKIENLEYQASQVKDLVKELEIYKQLNELQPNNLHYTSQIAWISESLGNHEEAIKYYKLILASKAKGYEFSPPITAQISRLYQKKHDYKLAITYMEQAIKENPSSFSLYNELAVLYLSQQDTINAIQNLNKSLTIQPLHKESYLTSFFIHINKGNYDVADKLIRDSYSINSNDFGTQYCYYLAQKYISKITIEDSVFVSIALNSGIKNRISEVLNFNSNGTYIINNRVLTKQERQIQLIKDAIIDYPYYPEFYKIYIQYIIDNKINQDIKIYGKDYLYYSKLNPDVYFIEKYLK